MSGICRLLLITLWFLAGLQSRPVSASQSHPFSFQDLFGMTRIAEPQPSPDGEWVVFTARNYSLETNTSNADLWLVKVDGGPARQLTTNPAQDFHARWSPDGKMIAFLSTRGGGLQIWTIDPSGGEAHPMTDLALDVGGFEWSPDGKKIAFVADVYPDCPDLDCTAQRDQEKEDNPVKARIYETLLFRHWDTWEDGKRQHVFVMPAAGGEPVDVVKGLDADTPTKPWGGTEEFAWSPDGAELCLTAKIVPNPAWSTDVDLYLVSAEGGELKCITEENEAWDTTGIYSPDGKTIAYLAMERPGYEADRFRIVLYDRSSETKRVLTQEWDRSVSQMSWSPGGTALYVAAGENGRKKLFRVEVKDGSVSTLVDDHHNRSMAVTSNNHLVFLRESFSSPSEIYTCDGNGAGLKKLTGLNDERVSRAQMSEAEEFWFKGAGGDRVHGWILKPAGFESGKKYPVAFMIHGGPQGSWSERFHYRWNPQTYTGAGYATIMIDFHGSTGYGQEFTDSIGGDWGGKPYQDLMLGLDYCLEQYDYLDGDRVGALGASFGGYMVFWIAGQTDRFKCLISHDGNFDEVAAYYMTEELWFPEWDHGGTEWENRQHYEAISPHTFVENWKTPLLVIHGALDYRVVDTGGLAAFTAAQRMGIPSKLLYFPDENHWVLKPKNSELWHRTVIDWLDQWLKQ